MIYEIFFDPKAGLWRVRITLIYWFFFTWSSIIHRAENEEGVTVPGPAGFPTYEAAELWATQVGLPKAYRLRKRSNGYITWVQAEGCHAAS